MDKVTKAFDAVNSFSSLPPKQQLAWWWKNVYKPFIVSIGPSLLASAIIGVLMKLTGNYTNFEVGIMIVLVFISSRLSSVCNILLRIEKRMEANRVEPKPEMAESATDNANSV